MKIPKVEYDVYCKLFDKNLIQLNISVCKNAKVDISIPIILNEDIKKLNSSSEYYNDRCHSASSDIGVYKPLNIRRKEFVENNKTVCQDNCLFSDYDYINQKAKCSCDAQKSSKSFKYMKINTSMLYNNFIDVKNIANINILVCYDKLFSKKGILHNIGFYLLIIIEIFHVICAYIFYKKELNTINNKINDIDFAVQNWELVKEDERQKKRKGKIKLKKVKIIKNENKKTENEFENKNNMTQKIIILPSPLDYYQMSKILNCQTFSHPPKKRKRMIRQIGTNSKRNFQITRSSSTKKTINSEAQNIISKCKDIMAFDDEEKNNLIFKLALSYDKRTFCEYYLSLLRIKHPLIFALYSNNDCNSRILKIDLICFGFAINYTVNALFFRDETMLQIFEDDGIFNFENNLPQIVYSFLISSILTMIVKFFALSESAILDFKRNKNKRDLNKRKMDLNNKLRIKFATFFILGFIFLLIFWYYLSMFCAIYENTQIHLIKDTLISFGLSFVYPLIYNIFPGMLRIPSLSNPKKKRNYMYSISKFLQLF